MRLVLFSPYVWSMQKGDALCLIRYIAMLADIGGFNNVSNLHNIARVSHLIFDFWHYINDIQPFPIGIGTGKAAVIPYSSKGG